MFVERQADSGRFIYKFTEKIREYSDRSLKSLYFSEYGSSRRPWNGTDGRSEQSRFVVADDLFEQAVVPFGVVLRFEVLPEDARQGLPESGHESAAEFPQYFVGGVVRLTVDEFEQYFALRAGHVFDDGRVLLLDLAIDAPDVGFLRFFGRQALQLGLHFGHARPGDLCDGVDFFDGRDQFAVAAQVGSAGEDPHRANADVGNRIARDDLPLLTGDARRLLRSDPECREYRRQQKEKVLFHRPRKISTFANVTIFWFNEITKRNNGTEKGIVVPELGDGIGRKYGRCDGFGRSGCFRHAGDGGVDGKCRDEGCRRCAAGRFDDRGGRDERDAHQAFGARRRDRGDGGADRSGRAQADLQRRCPRRRRNDRRGHPHSLCGRSASVHGEGREVVRSVPLGRMISGTFTFSRQIGQVRSEMNKCG